MRFPLINHVLLCAIINLRDNFYYKVEAISREISYPLGTVLGKDPDFFNDNSIRAFITPSELLEFKPNTEKPIFLRKTKKHFKRKLKKKLDDEIYTTSTNKMPTKRKKNKKRKKKARVPKKILKKESEISPESLEKNNESLEKNRESTRDVEDVLKFKLPAEKRFGFVKVKPRKPVDIVVHIKMEE